MIQEPKPAVTLPIREQEESCDDLPPSMTVPDVSSSTPTPRQPKKRHGARNQHRHKSFVKWIMDTFAETLKASDGSPILDVAGGKGEVAARLTMCHQQSVIMVDPRPADVVHCFETLVLPKIPNKWQRRLESQRADDPAFVSRTLHYRFRQLVCTFDDPPSEEVQAAINEACLLLGLHADAATEAIVDAGLKYKKPFVVVPCCVFPNFFVHRQLRQADGSFVQVRSHEQFCQYLAQKDPKLRVEELPFEGRNIAIWWDGKE